ncbi:MAG: septation protein SpoVG family protein [Rubripirellula sp.]
MEITEIRIKLMERSEDRLRGFCSITIENAFVIRDLKIIDGTNGPFVAMPSRKLSSNCQRCRHKNHLRSNYCNHCGTKLQQDDAEYATPQKLYADVAHPINSECREEIQQAVLAELESELARCEKPGYRSRYDDDFDLDEADSKNRELRTDNTTDTPSSKTARSETTQLGTSKRVTGTQTAEKAETTPEPGEDAGAETSDRETPTAKRIDNQSPDAVPAPMQPRTTKRKATAMPETDGNDDFGAGIF